MHARLCYQLDDIISLHCHSISLLFCFLLLLLLSLINIQTHIIFCHLEFFPLRKNGDGNQHLRYQMDQFSHHGKCFLPSRVIFMLPRFNFELHFSKTRYAFNKFKSFHYSKKKKNGVHLLYAVALVLAYPTLVYTWTCSKLRFLAANFTSIITPSFLLLVYFYFGVLNKWTLVGDFVDAVFIFSFVLCSF